jgi:hypothetical protein
MCTPARPRTPRQPEAVSVEHCTTTKFQRNHRASQSLSQCALAKRAYVAQVTTIWLECGHRAQLRNLVTLGRALVVTVAAPSVVDPRAEPALTQTTPSSAA